MNNKYTFLYGSKIYTKANDNISQTSTSIGFPPDAVDTTPITILAIISGVLPSIGPIDRQEIISYYEGSQSSIAPVPFSRAVLFYDQMGKALSDPDACPIEGCAPCTLTYAPCGPSGVIVALSENPATSGGEVRYFGALAPTVSVSPSINQSWAVLSNWSKDINGDIPASQLPGLYDTAVILRTVSVAPSTSPMIKHLIATNQAVVDLNIKMLGNALFLCDSSWGVQPNSTPYPSSSMKLLQILDTYPPNGNVTFRDSSGYYGNITPLSTTTIVCDTNRIGAKCNPLSSALPFVSASPTPSGRNTASFGFDSGTRLHNLATNVGTNGRASYYGTYDQTGNVKQWADIPNLGAPGFPTPSTTGSTAQKNVMGGNFDSTEQQIQAAYWQEAVTTESFSFGRGFRLASSSAGPLVRDENNEFGTAFVVVGDAGNDPEFDFATLGSVDHSFYIQKYPVTVSEYCTFLNSISSTHWIPGWLQKLNDRLRTNKVLIDVENQEYDWEFEGYPDPFVVRFRRNQDYYYMPYYSSGSRPMILLTWFDCARYTNWKHNGSPDAPPPALSYNAGKGTYTNLDESGNVPPADTEYGAYELDYHQTTGAGPQKNAGATFWIPDINEWYKAAYYKGGSTNAGYWKYATQSDEPPYQISAINKDGTALTLPNSGYMTATFDNASYDYDANSCVLLNTEFLFTSQPIVTFTTSGPETYVYSLQAGLGDYSNNKFNISSNTLYFNELDEGETLTAGGGFSVRVKAIGDGGTILYKVLTFSACSS